METLNLISVLRNLRSEDGKNGEYDRALVEVLADMLGIDREPAAMILEIEV